MFAATTQGGSAMAVPDVCKVPAPPAPPVPTPFPNTAMMNQAMSPTCSMSVMILNMAIITQKTEIPMTSGDEAGAAGGVVSSTIMGPAKFTRASTKVKVEGTPIVFQTCTTAQNGSNANAPTGLVMAPGQTKVMVLG